MSTFLEITLATLQADVASAPIRPYEAEWETNPPKTSQDPVYHTLRLWADFIPGHAERVRLHFCERGGDIELVSAWIEVRSDGASRTTPEAYLTDALELQVRFLTWLRERPYASERDSDEPAAGSE